MPVNQQDLPKIEAYNPSQEEKDLILRLNARIDDLKTYRSAIEANPYDTSKKARSIEETWDFADYVSLPHKYDHVEMQDWMAKDSRPMIYAKIDTALSVMIRQNPEIEMSAKKSVYDKKVQILKALYNNSWDKGHGRQQLIKFILNLAKYGFAVGREFHRYEQATVDEITVYDPVEFKHKTEKRKVVRHDEAFFEVLPIRDCWFDNRAKPYDEDSMRDWYWEVPYDYSTFLKRFPVEKYPNAKYVQPSGDEVVKGTTDKAELQGTISKPAVRLGFYESEEDDEFLITNGKVLIYKGQLLNHHLSCVPGMWRMRNDFTIYGVGLPEILEADQDLLDRVANMTINQIILAISGSGFYGGRGTVKEQDMILEPKLKKLPDAEKIVFPRIPMPDPMALTMIEGIKNEADEMSGVTKSLAGEQVGKTLGEAVLNREAGLNRMAIPLNNIEFALERHARLRIQNIQMIYSRPASTKVVVQGTEDGVGELIDAQLWEQYTAERERLGTENPEFIQKFPNDPKTGAVFRNQFREERLPFEKTAEGEVEPSGQDTWLEITPEEITGEFDVKIKALSMAPMSQALEASKALETFNIIAKLPYTDIYKAQKRLLKKRDENPEDWMKEDNQIMEEQQSAMQPMGGMPPEGGQSIPSEAPAGADTVVPPSNLEQPASQGGLSSQISNAVS